MSASCADTLLADAVASSVDEHARFGGVVPEVASRAHLEAMVPTMRRALDEAKVTLADIDAIAVTAGPGPGGRAAGRRRRGQGVRAGRSTSRSTASTTWPRTSPSTSSSTARCPSRAIALLVSGGHSSLLLVDDVTGDVTPLGATIDDAAGEAFDKVARLLGLPFPGGPLIDRTARDGDRDGHRFPAASPRRRTAWPTVSTSRSPG